MRALAIVRSVERHGPERGTDGIVSGEDSRELSPGKAQQLPRVSTEEVALRDSVFLTLGMYAKHQGKKGHCDCPGCRTVRKLVERAIEKGWKFPFKT